MFPIIIAGPTASGKSQKAVDLAMALKAKEKKVEIICCDSITVYRGFNIGAAKPSMEHQRLVPHHFIDILDPSEEFTAGNFVQLAHPLLERLMRDNIFPICVGGTGFYFRALLRGMASSEEEDKEKAALIRARLEKRAELEGFPALFQELLAKDPLNKTVHPNDHYRVLRALQAMELYQKPWSELNAEARQTDFRYPGTRFFCLELDREILRSRVHQRTKEMLSLGLVNEVEQLLHSGISPEAKAFKSIGYKETLAFVQKEIKTLEELELLIERATMRLAKSQMTWFRSERDVEWIDFKANVIDLLVV